MKITIEFNLPEEREEFELADQGANLASKMDEFDNWMRSFVKYQEREVWPDLEEVRKQFWEFRNPQ